MVISTGILEKRWVKYCFLFMKLQNVDEFYYLHKITLYKRPIWSNSRNQHIFYPLIVVTRNRILEKKIRLKKHLHILPSKIAFFKSCITSQFHHCCYCSCSVSKSCVTHCNPMDCSTPGSSVLHYPLEFIKFMSIEMVIPFNHLILCQPLLFLTSIFPSIRIFSNELALHIR